MAKKSVMIFRNYYLLELRVHKGLHIFDVQFGGVWSHLVGKRYAPGLDSFQKQIALDMM